MQPLAYSRLATVLVVAMALCVSTAHAQRRRGAAQNPQVPTASGSSIAGDRVSLAKRNLAEGNQEQEVAKKRIEMEFKQRPEWIAAQNELNEAKKELEAAKNAVLETLKTNAAYLAAIAARTQASKALADIRDSGDINALSAASRQNAQAASAVTQLESRAITNDPVCQAAQKRVDAATSGMRVLEAQLQHIRDTDTELMAAKQKIMVANIDLAAAQNELREAEEREAQNLKHQQDMQQEQLRRQQIENQRRELELQRQRERQRNGQPRQGQGQGRRN